eukprot:UN06411
MSIQNVVWYRMKNDTEPTRVQFEGTVISVGELKIKVIENHGHSIKNLESTELKVKDEETGKQFIHENEYIAKNTHLIITPTLIRGKKAKPTPAPYVLQLRLSFNQITFPS